jgi:hypothetical protein
MDLRSVVVVVVVVSGALEAVVEAVSVELEQIVVMVQRRGPLLQVVEAVVERLIHRTEVEAVAVLELCVFDIQVQIG